MTGIPNFSEIPFAPAAIHSPALLARPLAHARKHSGQARLRQRRPRRHRLPRYLSRHRALSARPLPDHVRHPAMDRAAICRILHGGRFQRVLPAQPRRRPKGPLGRVRSRHPPRLRLRSSARRRRCRHGGRRDRLDLRHAHAVFRHSARPDVGVDDHERRGAAGAGALHRRRRGTGRAAGETFRHDPERHPQRIHGAQHLHLSAGALDADHLRHFLVHLGAHAEIQFDLDFRLSHPGGRRDARPRTRLYAGRRRRISARRNQSRSRHRCVCAAAVVLLEFRDELFHGNGQATRRAAAVGQAHEAVQSQIRKVADAARAHPDFRLVADLAGRLQQRGAHLHRGDGGDARAYPVAAHQLV